MQQPTEPFQQFQQPPQWPQPPNPYPQQQWQTPSQPQPPQQQWQQQPNYAQPQSYYPSPPMPLQQQQPQQNKPQQPPTKAPTQRSSSRSAWQWILLGLIVGIFIGYAIHVPSSQSSTDSNANTTQDTAQATSQPTQASTQAAPTPILTIAPISLSGTGQQASHKFQLQQGLAIFKLTHNGASNFIVHLLDSNGQVIDDLVNEIGSFDGSKAEGIQNAGTYVLDIEADGKWTVTIQQPRPTTAPFTINFSGKGQAATQLFSMQSGLKTIKMTHDGTSNFIIHILDSNGNVVDDIVNEIGKFNGSKAEGIQNDGIYLFDVQADGNWTISIQ